MILKDKVVIVTGGNQGIGKVIAMGLAGEGAQIVINYIENEKAAKDLLLQIKNIGQAALKVKGDVSIEEDVKRIVSDTVYKFKKIDILVNNAGLRTIAYLKKSSCPVMEMDVKDWDRMIAVNLRGPFLMSKQVLPQMKKQKTGSIINISSGAGVRGVPGKSAYAASKHALEGFTKSLAGEVKDLNIRVNSLAPGGRVDIDGRGGLPENVIIPACIYLASDKSQDISGETITSTKWNRDRGINIT
jgi:3-oxoacyl-[acyl-carrier protein] reductase